MAADTTRILLVDIKGPIGFVAADRLVKAIQQAASDRAELLVVRLDTPGGLLSSTREMTQAILSSQVPVAMYVAPSGARAASAGTYLVYAAHVAAMAPGTHLGAATPVPLGAPGLPGPAPSKPGADKQPDGEPADTGGRKSLNDAVAYIRTLAELRHRNADWGEKAVREAATLTGLQAQKEGVVDVVAGDVTELLAAIDGRSIATAYGNRQLATKGASVTEVRSDWRADLMSVITDPNIAFILFLVGVYGLLFELWSPGAVLPGVLGGISLIVALTALSVLPVNYGGLALLLLGMGFMLAEAHAPSFGLLGAGGIAAFVLGALFLFNPSDANFPIAVAWPVIAGAALASAAFFAGVINLALKARRRPVRTGAEQMLESIAEVVSWSDGQGRVRVHGEIWSARSDHSFHPGEKVRIVGIEGLTLNVEAAKANEVDSCSAPKA